MHTNQAGWPFVVRTFALLVIFFSRRETTRKTDNEIGPHRVWIRQSCEYCSLQFRFCNAHLMCTTALRKTTQRQRSWTIDWGHNTFSPIFFTLRSMALADEHGLPYRYNQIHAYKRTQKSLDYICVWLIQWSSSSRPLPYRLCPRRLRTRPEIRLIRWSTRWVNERSDG